MVQNFLSLMKIEPINLRTSMNHKQDESTKNLTRHITIKLLFKSFHVEEILKVVRKKYKLQDMT